MLKFFLIECASYEYAIVKYCTKLIECRMRRITNYQQHLEGERAANDASCSMDGSIRLLKNLVIQKEIDYTLCVAHENSVVDKTRRNAFQMRCNHLPSKKRSVEGKNWAEEDEMNKECSKYFECCPSATQCQQTISQLQYATSIMRKHLEISGKILKCHIKLGRLLLWTLRHSGSGLSPKYMKNIAAPSMHGNVADGEEGFGDDIKFSDKAIVRENAHPVESVPDGSKKMKRKPHHSKANYKIQCEYFLKSIIAKLLMKLNVSNSTGGKYSMGEPGSMNVRMERATKTLLIHCLDLLTLLNNREIECNITPPSGSQAVNKDLMGNFDWEMQIPELTHSKPVNMGVYGNPFITDTIKKTFQTVESSKLRNDSGKARIAGSGEVRMWTSTTRSISNEALKSFVSKDYLEAKGNKPREKGAQALDIYAEEIVDGIDKGKELKGSSMAAERNNPSSFTSREEPSPKAERSTSAKNAEKTTRRKLPKAMIGASDGRRLKHLKKYGLKFRPTTFPSTSRTTTASARYPSNFFAKYSEIFTPKDVLLQDENKRRNLLRPFHKFRRNEHDIFRDDTAISHNSIISSNDFFAELLKRTDSQWSISGSEAFPLNPYSVATAQSTSKAMKFIKSKSPKHNIAKFTMAERKRFSRGNYRGIGSGEEWERNMLAEERENRIVKKFSDYRAGSDPTNEANISNNGIWTVIPTWTTAKIKSDDNSKFMLGKASIKSSLKELKRINIELKERRLKRGEISSRIRN
ncbi:unnamed protein product [Litomosoides sigmodontis]|uniref:Uncharacterized protein n=1 Tax=Litomosoides sigmodontis TaxID=42156 RepID=A0A3P6SFR6_LITSI|nr:unnamed protein product [Litomosoides sigmodontis]